ncbi:MULTISPECIES: TonB-dependent receptor domain-containing protein [unclassified Nitrospina]|uniref:TonB-dependent receptor domain-containing protein n=1 Tax=unclassified Nitrospina TaxID=2638683 RepID=UPI003F9B7700
MSSLFLAASMLVMAPSAHSQNASGSNPEAVSPAGSGKVQFNIPPQNLGSALTRFGETSDLQLIYDSEIATGLKTRGVQGAYSPKEAMEILLEGTGLDYRFANSRTVTVTRVTTLGKVEVSATRGIGELMDSPQGVTIVDREEVEKQLVFSSDLGDMLGKTVPGLGTSTEGLTDVGQTLRGQNMYVLIDGVPQTIPLRNGQRNLRTIDPSAIERIEVLRGSTSVYGLGGTGGLINIITKKPGKGKPQFTTDLTLGFAPVSVGQSLRKRLMQSVQGSEKKFDYIFSVTAEQTGSFYDGDGDRIPPDPNGQGGLADSDSYNLFGKMGFDVDENQRFEFSLSLFKIKQDTDFILVDGVTGVKKTTAVEGSTPGKDMGTENLQVNLNYLNKDVMGSLVKGQLYYRDYFTRFGFFPAPTFGSGGQNSLDSQRIGGRLDVETPFSMGRVLWGLDLLYEETAQPMEDGRFFVPEMDQITIGPFLQTEVVVNEALTLHGGARFEQILFEVDDYTTVYGNNVQGGDLDYERAVFNAGVTYAFDQTLSVFASFSQGFTVPEIGRVLRNAPAGTSVENIRPKAQVVDNYEVGVRGNWSRVQGEISLFYSESDLGTSLTSPALPSDPILVLRIPERVYGVEASFDTQPVDRWEMGGTLTLMEGELDSDNNGNFDSYMLGNRIPPLKVTGYVENQTRPNWRNRLQVLYSGNRDRFNGQTGFGKGTVGDFYVVDLLSVYKFKVGTLKVGIRNLLDELYFPTISQMYNFNNRYSAGMGRTISATYSIKW